MKFVILTRALIVIPHNLIGPWCDVITAKHRHSCFCLSRRKCAHLVVPPQPGQAVGVHDAEDFTFWILPADVVLVPAVWQELVDVVPQQPAVCTQTTRVSSHDTRSFTEVHVYTVAVAPWWNTSERHFTPVCKKNFDTPVKYRDIFRFAMRYW